MGDTKASSHLISQRTADKAMFHLVSQRTADKAMFHLVSQRTAAKAMFHLVSQRTAAKAMFRLVSMFLILLHCFIKTVSRPSSHHCSLLQVGAVLVLEPQSRVL